MNIGIVTTWFERGAAYVSKQFEEVLEKDHTVYIYARGEEYAIGNPNWDKRNVTWGKKIDSPFAGKVIDKKDFKKWISSNDIELILFNEQHWFQPLLWCKEWKIKTVAYIDYYTERTVDLFQAYDMLICNTKRHFSVFSWHKGAIYLPWGTNVDLFKPIINEDELVKKEFVTFFHSCGWNIERKGTRMLLEAFEEVKNAKKLIIHSQHEITEKSVIQLIKKLENEGRLEIITKTVPAPGLFHLGDVYLYPTILEGIGLTIAEALSSGLATVVPDNGPMNEFVKDKVNGRLIDIEKCYARNDGYYWPKCIPKRSHLVKIIDELAQSKDIVIEMKKSARKNSISGLSFERNLKSLNSLITSVELMPLKNEVIDKIKAFDNYGFKKMNKYYMIFPTFFNFLRKNFFA